MNAEDMIRSICSCDCSVVPHRGQSTFSDNPVPATGGTSRYSSILPDTTSLTEKTATSPSRPRSAIRAREYERELERTSAATSGQSVLERRPKSSSPMLRPYRWVPPTMCWFTLLLPACLTDLSLSLSVSLSLSIYIYIYILSLVC